jgi:immunoglobulin-binding protein 1
MEKKEYEYSEEELLEEYGRILKQIGKSENSEEEANPTEILKQLLVIEKEIRNLCLFSPNEEYSEIQSEYLELIDLPYLIALMCQKIRENRLDYIKESEKYFNIYISLLVHYENCPELVKKIFSKMKEESNFNISREDKITLYKLEKILKEEINKEKNKDFRKFCKINSQIKAVDSMNKLLLIPQEIQILEFKRKLDNDPELKKKYDEEQKNYSPPQMNFVKIDAKARTPNEIIEQYLQQRGIDLPDSLKPKVDISMNPNLNTDVIKTFIPQNKFVDKSEMKKELFKPSFPQPTMTLEEHGELEYTLMKNKMEQNEYYQKEKRKELDRLGIKDESDSDNELVSEQKTYKDRNWDDWKDLNDKGQGNTMK